jgi:hypothetical protein
MHVEGWKDVLSKGHRGRRHFWSAIANVFEATRVAGRCPPSRNNDEMGDFLGRGGAAAFPFRRSLGGR